MHKKRKNKNYVFIDGNNLYLGAKSQRIRLHYGDFCLYLRNKLNAEKVFLFIGYDPKQVHLYERLKKYGYSLVFKPTVIYNENGKRTMKGNVDAELVLHSAAIEYDNYDSAIIVTSDGDFTCLAEYLRDNKKLFKVITPTKYYSSLMRPFNSYILPLSSIRANITRNRNNKKCRHSRSVQRP